MCACGVRGSFYGLGSYYIKRDFFSGAGDYSSLTNNTKAEGNNNIRQLLGVFYRVTRRAKILDSQGFLGNGVAG